MFLIFLLWFWYSLEEHFVLFDTSEYDNYNITRSIETSRE